VDLEMVARLAGHKDINVTKRYIKSQVNKQKLEEDINNAFMDKTKG
jgi:integrase/recombinase XerD